MCVCVCVFFIFSDFAADTSTHTYTLCSRLMGLNGSHTLCMAAKHHSVPVIVCSAMFKLCPRYLCSYDQVCVCVCVCVKERERES